MNLNGKTVVVTGGASGIGRALSLRFAEEGAKVVVADLPADNARRLRRKIVDELGTTRLESMHKLV